VTILTCSTAACNHYLELTLEKSKKLRTFKNLTLHHCRFDIWTKTVCGWVLISSENVLNRICSITEFFLVVKLAKKKAILVIDNALSHQEKLKNGEIKAVFLPPNINSLSIYGSGYDWSVEKEILLQAS
jgi:hypothetical protein